MRRSAIGLLLALAVLVAPLAATAQPRGHIPVVGVLIPGDLSLDSDPFQSAFSTFRQGLHELGYVEGQTIRLEHRYAAWKWDRLPSLAAALVQLKPDVMVTFTTPGALAAKQATTTTPIVVAVSGDLVAEGIVASLAHPGGNITGQNLRDPELAGKRLELLKEEYVRDACLCPIRHKCVLRTYPKPSHCRAPRRVEGRTNDF
jgi:putative ABC transport system substrate-binding protein